MCGGTGGRFDVPALVFVGHVVLRDSFDHREITGGIHGRNRIGGNGLADAFTFGMIAAENLVSES